ncbi:MAG: N-acyl homoserine lactonase family protein [Lachnospiraceae bacterium]|nr:N-acyl homoserine lactonase family protein [Lachnospiraceae bacterium]
MGAKWKITPMELGWIKMPYMTLIFDETADEETNKTEYQVPLIAYLLTNVDTGEKRLVDCGADHEYPELLAAHKTSPGHDGHSAMTALATRGIKPDDITTIYVTHLHWDHAWGIRYFPKAKVVVQKYEVEYGSNLSNRGYRSPYDSTITDRPLPFFLGFYNQMEFIDGDTDLGDGIKAFTCPGHSGGSQGFLIDTPDGWYCLAGDIMYIQKCLDMRRPSGGLYDVRTGFESAKKVCDLIEKHKATFLPSHHFKTLEMVEDSIVMNKIPDNALR